MVIYVIQTSPVIQYVFSGFKKKEKEKKMHAIKSNLSFKNTFHKFMLTLTGKICLFLQNFV